MKMEDLLFTETDDACAICGIRGFDRLTIHHIDINPNNNVYDNMIVLCFNCHQQFHHSKGVTLDQIKQRKLHLIHKTLTQYGINALKIASRNNYGVIATSGQIG